MSTDTNICECCKMELSNNENCHLCTTYCKLLTKLKSNTETRRVVNLEKTFGETLFINCIDCYVSGLSPCHQCLQRLNGDSIKKLVYTNMTYDQLKEYSDEFYSGHLELPDTFSDFILINNI